MAVYTTNKEDKFILECDCGCGEAVAVNFDFMEDYDDIFMEIKGCDFYHEQDHTLRRRLRRAWNGITGKDKNLTEICMNTATFREFVGYMNDKVFPPVKPIEYTKDGWFVCPNCEEEQQINFITNNTYCSNCGAHIDDSYWRK